jgi:hypothetical protein
MRYGTSHFENIGAARSYYLRMRYTLEDVQRKIDEGEISIGAPKLPPGATLKLDEDRRYHIEESEKPKGMQS